MSGVSVTTTHQAATCNVDSQGKVRYTAYYLVKVSSAADGPQVVVDYLATQGVYWGCVYTYGNDSDYSVFCDGITPVRVDQSLEYWNVTVTYGPPEEKKEQDPSGNPSEEPNDWIWQHNMGYSCWQEPCWKAQNYTAFPHPLQVKGGSYTRSEMVTGPIVTSANVVLDPTLMRDVFDLVWQVTCYSRTYDNFHTQSYMGAINSDFIKFSSWLVNNYGFEEAFFATYSAKCTNASATFRVATINKLRIPYWEWSWEFRFRKETWIEYVLDRGITCRPMDGMPTGTHGSNPNYPNDAITEGRAPVIPVMDSEGKRIPEMVLFNGGGYPMLPDDARYDTGYYFGWIKDPVLSFKDIPFDFFDEGS